MTHPRSRPNRAEEDLQPAHAFEEQVLLAVMRCGETAYGMTIRRALEERTGRDVCIGAVYATLNRMEEKEWVVSRRTPSGRPRRYFTVTPEGGAAVREALRIRDALWEGLDPQLLPGS